MWESLGSAECTKYGLHENNTGTSRLCWKHQIWPTWKQHGKVEVVLEAPNMAYQQMSFYRLNDMIKYCVYGNTHFASNWARWRRRFTRFANTPGCRDSSRRSHDLCTLPLVHPCQLPSTSCFITSSTAASKLKKDGDLERRHLIKFVAPIWRVDTTVTQQNVFPRSSNESETICLPSWSWKTWWSLTHIYNGHGKISLFLYSKTCEDRPLVL